MAAAFLPKNKLLPSSSFQNFAHHARSLNSTQKLKCSKLDYRAETEGGTLQKAKSNNDSLMYVVIITGVRRC